MAERRQSREREDEREGSKNEGREVSPEEAIAAELGRDRAVPVEEVEGEPAGIEEVRDLDTTLGAAASGVLLSADQEQAQQRLHDAQIILAELGYLTGERGDPGAAVDARWGPRTRDAVAAFQEDRGLERTGQLDVQTYEALLAEHENALGAKSDDLEPDDFSPLHPNKPLAD